MVISSVVTLHDNIRYRISKWNSKTSTGCTIQNPYSLLFPFCIMNITFSDILLIQHTEIWKLCIAFECGFSLFFSRCICDLIHLVGNASQTLPYEFMCRQSEVCLSSHEKQKQNTAWFGNRRMRQNKYFFLSHQWSFLNLDKERQRETENQHKYSSKLLTFGDRWNDQMTL